MDTLDPNLQQWLADNLLAGCTPEQLMPVMASLNIPSALAAAEIVAAQNHPYMAAARKVNHTLKRRESLLRTLDWYQRQQPGYLTLERKPLPPFQDFLRDHYYPNRPGLFRGAVDHWPAMQWTPRRLLDKIGADTLVQIQHGRDSDKDYEVNSTRYKHDMRFGDFIDKVENTISNDFYLTANNAALEGSAFHAIMDDVKNIGDGYLDQTQTAQRMFLWIGPQGTITPLHHDLTHNVFIQIYGTKRFRLIPAMQAPYTYNDPHVFSRVDLLNPKLEEFPLFAQTTAIDITIDAGDFLYIPIGWWHHVVSETVSISLSFTNVSAQNSFVDFPSD